MFHFSHVKLPHEATDTEQQGRAANTNIPAGRRPCSLGCSHWAEHASDNTSQKHTLMPEQKNFKAQAALPSPSCLGGHHSFFIAKAGDLCKSSPRQCVDPCLGGSE